MIWNKKKDGAENPGTETSAAQTAKAPVLFLQKNWKWRDWVYALGKTYSGFQLPINNYEIVTLAQDLIKEFNSMEQERPDAVFAWQLLRRDLPDGQSSFLLCRQKWRLRS